MPGMQTPGQVVGQGVSPQGLQLLQNKNTQRRQQSAVAFQEAGAARRQAMASSAQLQLQALQNMAEDRHQAEIIRAQQEDRKLQEKLTKLEIAADERGRRMIMEHETQLASDRRADMRKVIGHMIRNNALSAELLAKGARMDRAYQLKVLEATQQYQTDLARWEVAKENLTDKYEQDQRLVTSAKESGREAMRRMLDSHPVSISLENRSQAESQVRAGVINTLDAELRSVGLSWVDLTTSGLVDSIRAGQVKSSDILTVLGLIEGVENHLAERAGAEGVPWVKKVTEENLKSQPQKVRSQVAILGGVDNYNEWATRQVDKLQDAVYAKPIADLQRIKQEIQRMAARRSDKKTYEVVNPAWQAYTGESLGAALAEHGRIMPELDLESIRAGYNTALEGLEADYERLYELLRQDPWADDDDEEEVVTQP